MPWIHAHGRYLSGPVSVMSGSCREALGEEPRVTPFRLFGLSKGKIKSRRADSNRFPAPATSALLTREGAAADTSLLLRLSTILLCGDHSLLKRHETLAEYC